MPKADDIEDDEEYRGPDGDHYANEITAHKDSLKELVEENRWLVDLAAFFTLYVASTSIFVMLVGRVMKDGADGRLIAGLVVCFIFIACLFSAADRAVQIGCAACLAKIRQFLRIPHDVEYRHNVLHGTWKALAMTMHVAGMTGLSFFFAEVVKNAWPS